MVVRDLLRALYGLENYAVVVELPDGALYALHEGIEVDAEQGVVFFTLVPGPLNITEC